MTNPTNNSGALPSERIQDALRHQMQRNHDFNPAGCSGCEQAEEALREVERLRKQGPDSDCVGLLREAIVDWVPTLPLPADSPLDAEKLDEFVRRCTAVLYRFDTAVEPIPAEQNAEVWREECRSRGGEIVDVPYVAPANPVCPKCREGVTFTVRMHLGLGMTLKPLFVRCGTCGHFIGNFEQMPAAKRCKHGNPYCPCQDGDSCRYEGENPMPKPKTGGASTPSQTAPAPSVKELK